MLENLDYYLTPPAGHSAGGVSLSKEHMSTIDSIYDAYDRLLRKVDTWFSACVTRYPALIRCGKGCSGCCRSLFDITLLDAWFLNHGFRKLPDDIREVVRRKARLRLEGMRRLWPDWEEPYLLNLRPDEEWEDLMPDEDETPCVLLAEDGRCLVYEHRPMTCRLHGLPLMDISGEDFHDDWCTENFVGTDPAALTGLRFPFHDLFDEELKIFREFTLLMVKQKMNELDTFIPMAVLVDFDSFDWEEWGRKNIPAIRQVQEGEGV